MSLGNGHVQNFVRSVFLAIAFARSGQLVAASSPLTPRGQQLWQDYLESLPLTTLQDGCQPRIYWPPAGVAYRGVALLFHGFTACPQQYEELAQRLTARGFAVVVPLLPGHGRQWTTESVGDQITHLDQTPDLPTGLIEDSDNYQSYSAMVHTINRLAAEFSGERVVGGLSVGAVVAAAATVDQPQLWTRQLIMSPFFEVGIAPVRMIFGGMANLDQYWQQAVADLSPMLGMTAGWGQACEDERALSYVERYGLSEIRAGICQFKITHVLAINQFGFSTWSQLQATKIQTQYLGAQGDLLINQQLLFNGVGRLRGEQLGLLPFTTADRFDDDPNVRICYLPSDNMLCAANEFQPLAEQKQPCVNHSLLSRYDNPEQNKYWINLLLTRAVDFIADGRFVPADATTRAHGDPLCLAF